MQVGVKKNFDFRPTSRFISEIIQDRAIGTTTGTCSRPVTPPIQPSSTCQPISLIIPTLIIQHSFTPGSKPTFLTNSYHLMLLLPAGLPRRTGLIMHIILCLFSHLNLLFIPCCRLSWLTVSFLLHVKYTLSYRIVSQ